MSKIENFDPKTCRVLSDEILKALQPLADKYGLVLKPGNGVYSDGRYTAKVEFAAIGNDGVAKTKEVEEFNKYHGLVGLEKEDFGKTFVNNGRTFAVCGLKFGTKMPILGRETTSGKIFKFTVDAVKKIRPSVTA